MRYRELGKTGLMVSEIGFGGEWMDGTPDEARAVFDAATDAGINIVDCWMPDPTRRSNLGYGMRGRRDKWIVQGHFGSVWKDGQYVRTRDLELVKPAFDDQLRYLESDHIELGMIHYVDEADEFERILDSDYFRFIQQMKDEGVIDHIGLSTHRVEVGMKAIESGVVEMMLFSSNPAFDIMPHDTELDDLFVAEKFVAGGNGIDPKRAEFYRACENAGVGLTAMKPFAGGRLLDAKLSPFGVALTPVQCIHYGLTHPAISSLLIGYSKPEHVAAAIAYETASEDELDYASVLASAPAHNFSAQCTYCGHCAPCVMGIDIAMVNKLADLALMHDEVPDSVRGHYEALEVRADSCIGCAACEPNCPFGVPIAERMAQTAELFA